MTQLLSIVDDKLIIDKLRVKWTEGPLTHTGGLEVVGETKFNDDVKLAKNATVSGTITADTLNVKHIICDEPNGVNDPFAFTANTEDQLDGKGFHFTDGNLTRQFVYKTGGKLFSTENIDIAREKVFSIDSVPVITATSLGDGIVNSGLQTVGDLKSLNVTGAVSFAEFAFFNNVHNRFGINTDSPNGSIGILENNVDIVIGSYKNDYAYIGTYNNSNLELGIDNTAKITLRNTGEIDFGNSKYKNAVVRVHGKLEVDEIVCNNQHSQPLTFIGTPESSIFGTGIVWYQGTSSHQFAWANDPDRIKSSEIIDLDEGKYYAINNAMVLSRNSLGDTVTDSNLTLLGTLKTLTVGGESTFRNTLHLETNLKVDGANELTLNEYGFNAKNSFAINCDSEQEFKIDSNGSIELGNRQNTNRRVSVYGQMSIGSSNPEPGYSLTVSGPVSLNNKKFVTGVSAPTAGRFSKGDICWNTDPKPTDYIGWVCIREGTPGEWVAFGQIKP